MPFKHCVRKCIQMASAQLQSLIGLCDGGNSRYVSKCFSQKSYCTQKSSASSVMLYYRPSMRVDPAHDCNIGMATRLVFYVLGIILLYVTIRKLLAHFPIFFVPNAKSSGQIDKAEVELYTIDSVNEFERMSQTQTSNETLVSTRLENENGRNRYDCQQDSGDNSDTYDANDGFNKTQEAHYKKEQTVYTVLTQQLSSVKRMPSQIIRSTTDDDKVSLCPKQHLKDARKESNRTLSRDTRAGEKIMENIAHEVAKMKRDRSVNTEIKTFAMANNNAKFSRFNSSYTENDTDLEKEMVFVDFPANYYYQKRLSSGQPSPCLINLNKQRRKSSRR